MSAVPWLKIVQGAALVAIKAQPRASATGIAGVYGSELRIRIAAPPVDSAANEALRTFLAERLEVPLRQISLVKGAAQTHKVVAIAGVDPAEIVRRLSPK